MESKNNSPVSI